jgi:shikimate dehydrogenase
MSLDAAPPGLTVSDIVYVPLQTRLLRDAAAHGLKPVEGLGMLLHQAVPGFEAWFGIRPEVDEELYRIVAADLL